MIFKLFYYSSFLYARISGLDGEISGPSPEDETFGCVILTGGMEVLDSNYPEQIGLIFEDRNCFIPKLIGDQTFKVLGDTEWCCFNRNGTGERTFVYQEVIDTFTLPVHTGFVVISGSVIIDGIVINQDDYFRPRIDVCLVEGNAKMVLVNDQVT